MKINIKIIPLLLFLVVLIISFNIISATDLNNSDTDFSNPNIMSKDNIKTDSYAPKTITLNNKNFNQYVIKGEFNDEVSDGDTIDVDGMLDSDKFSLTVNKSVNFISSKNNSYISLYTQNTGDYGEATGGQLTFGHGASGSNITNLYFYNTRIQFTNVSNININNITVIDYEKNIGSGTGHFIIGGQSDNVNITNSYFYTKDNGQHSTAVFSGCSNILFENNTIIGEGAIGNLLYLNTFNVDLDENSASHSNFIIRNNVINASLAPSQITCFAICLTGSNILIDNNTVDYNGTNICPIFGGQGVLENITLQNNNLRTVQLGSAGIISVKYINNTRLINNTISGLIISKSEESTHKAEIYNNTIQVLRLEADNCIIEGNNLKQINNTGNNNIINNNTISTTNNYTIITTGENTTITNNKLASKDYYGDESINGIAMLENNTESHIITITDDNIGIYATYDETTDDYYLNSTLLYNSQINLKSSKIHSLSIGDMQTDYNITFTSIDAPNLYRLGLQSYTNTTFLNINLPQTYIVAPLRGSITMENCIFLCGGRMKASSARIITMTNTSFINNTQNTFILSNVIDTPSIANEKQYTGYFDSTTNKLLGTISNNINLIIRNYNTTYNTPMVIDKPINITSYDSAIWSGDITFISGSEGSNITGLIINSTLNIQANNIKVFNNTIKKIVMDNCMACNIHNNTFNTTETAIELNGALNSNITENTIYTTGEYTISLDSDTMGNIIKNNLLIAGNTYNINSISGNVNENTITDNNPLLNTTISIDLQDTTLINTEIPINITVNSDTGVVDNGYIVILVNGVEQANKTLTNGRLETIITPTQKGVNTVKAWYFPSNLYNINSQTKELTVNSIKTILNITDVTTAKIGENITVTTTIKDSNNNNINEGEIQYTIGNDTYTSPIDNGISTINITTKEEYKNAELITYYPGANSYDNATNRTSLSLNSGEAILTIEQEDNEDKVTLTITVTDINNNKVKSGYIQFKGDVTDLIELQNGTLTYNITKSTTDMTINVTFRLNQAFETKTEQITIKAPITTITTLNDIIGLIDTPTTIIATIKDSNGTNINRGHVTFTDNEDNILAEVQVTDGTATTTITTNEEINTTITATYNPETNDYLPSSDTCTLSIQKPITLLTIDDITPTAGQTVTLTARLTDQLENNITGGKVVFKVNGKTLKDSSGKVIYAKVENGVATAEYTIPNSMAESNITIQATYTGTSKYNKETAEITTEVAKQEATLTIDELPESIQANSNITITARVQAGDTPITTGKVVFKINGKTLKDDNGKVIYAKVDSNGTATITGYNIGDLKATSYTLKAVFIATGYNKLEANQTIDVIRV